MNNEYLYSLSLYIWFQIDTFLKNTKIPQKYFVIKDSIFIQTELKIQRVIHKVFFHNKYKLRVATYVTDESWPIATYVSRNAKTWLYVQIDVVNPHRNCSFCNDTIVCMFDKCDLLVFINNLILTVESSSLAFFLFKIYERKCSQFFKKNQQRTRCEWANRFRSVIKCGHSSNSRTRSNYTHSRSARFRWHVTRTTSFGK